MNDDTLEQKKARLVKEIDDFRKRQASTRRRNGILSTLLIASGIGLSLLAGITGLLDFSVVAGIIALLVSASVATEAAFKFGEKTDFYGILVSECDNLKIALQFRVDSSDKLDLIVEKFQIVMTTSANSLPRGEGMGSVKKLYEGLDRAGILAVPELEGGA